MTAVNAQLASPAVMARRVEPDDSLDFFPTPPWATRALTTHVLPQVWRGPDLFDASALDPAAGLGHMAGPLAERFRQTMASDIADHGPAMPGYGGTIETRDFLHPDLARHAVVDGQCGLADWIITNPPFNAAVEFAMRGLWLARRGAAMLVRMQFLEGGARYERLFKRRPPQMVAVFAERVPMHRGRWVANGTTATAYAWLVWLKHPPHDWGPTRMMWIAPGCRTALTTPDDLTAYGAVSDLPKRHPAMQDQGDSASMDRTPMKAGAAPLFEEAP